MALGGRLDLSGLQERQTNNCELFSQISNLLSQLQQWNVVDEVASNNERPSKKPYVSCIKVNGVPILPPILDETEKKEMRRYRDEAVRRMKQRKLLQNQILTDTSDSMTSSIGCVSHSPVTQAGDALCPDNIPGTILEKPKSSDSTEKPPFANAIPKESYECIPPNHQVPSERNDPKFSSNLITSFLSDFGSLEGGLFPTEMSGMPLTSPGEPQITKDLSTLTKHLPDKYGSDTSDHSDSNFDLIFGASDQLKDNSGFTKSEKTESSKTKARPEDSASHLLQDASDDILKAPIFLSSENGLELHALPTESKKCTKTNVKKEPSWIMDSPLIAYVTKKRPETVGMSSNSPQKPIKIQQIGNATFTVDLKADGQENEIVRPIISGTQNPASANVAQTGHSNNSVSPKLKLRNFSAANQSCENINININNSNNHPNCHSSDQEVATDVDDAVASVSPVNSSPDSLNNSTADTYLSEPNSEDDAEEEKASPPLDSSGNLSVKDHLSDNSLDELFGSDKIGFVPRKDGDGSELKDLNIPVKSGVVNKTSNSQQPASTPVFLPTKPFLASPPPVTTDAYQNLPVSVATTLLTLPCSPRACSPLVSSDSAADHSSSPEDVTNMSSSNDTNLIPQYCSNPAIRRGSYTLHEPSVNLSKYFSHPLHNSHRDKDSDSNCSDSDKIPSYEDFESQLLKKNSENLSPSSIKYNKDSLKSEQQFWRENKNSSNQSNPQSSPIRKEKIPRNSLFDSSISSTASCQRSLLNSSNKRRPMNKKEDKCNQNTCTLYHTVNGGRDQPSKHNIHTSKSPGQSAAIEEVFNWEDMIEDELRSFFSEKRQSFMKMQRQFKEYEEQFEEEYRKTLDSMHRSQCWTTELMSEASTHIPDVSMTSNESHESASLSHQQASSFITLQRKPYQLRPDQDAASIISATAKGYLTRALLSTPRVQSLCKTIQECLKLLDETSDSSNSDLVNRLNNQLDAARLDLHDVFFETTAKERLNIIHQSRLLAARKLEAKPQPITSATQKYLMRKNQVNKSIASSSSSLSFRLHPPPSLIPPAKYSTKKHPNQQIPKTRIVSVAGKMTATRLVSTKTKDVPSLKVSSSKPWR
ncbi:putative uncharacterized protein DDB_G0277255 [Argonauta hians]